MVNAKTAQLIHEHLMMVRNVDQTTVHQLTSCYKMELVKNVRNFREDNKVGSSVKLIDVKKHKS